MRPGDSNTAALILPARLGDRLSAFCPASYVPPSPSSHPLSPGRGRNRARAFTIVEVMMASVILVVGFMGMIQAVTIGSEMLATARRQTLAAQILNHEMEKLRLTAWSSMPTAGTSTVTIDSTFSTAVASTGVSYTLSRTVTTLTTDLVEVTYTITWTKSGTNTAATTPTGSWFQKLAFYRESPIARTYSRTSTSWFTKYGLNHAAQRS